MIDRGCKHICVTSNNQFFDSKHLSQRQRQIQVSSASSPKQRQSPLKRLQEDEGKENRFVKDTNHCISKKIVALPFDTFEFSNS